MQTGLVSLSYDGSLPCHLEVAVSHLMEAGLRGTFYCEPALLLESLPEWAAVLAMGHELGNGSLHGAVLDDGSLPGWSLQMVEEDVSEAKSLIEDLFPEQKGHSFGFPWGEGLSDGLDIAPAVREVYDVVRTGKHGINGPDLDRQKLNCVLCDELDSHELVAYARKAADEGSWVIFAFEGVGEGERGIDAAAHRDLCLYLSTAPIRVLPVVEAATVLARTEAKSYKLV